MQSYNTVFCDWLLLLHGIMFSRFIRVVEHIRTSFRLVAEKYSIEWLWHILFVHSSVDGHLGYFHVLAPNLFIFSLWNLLFKWDFFCGYQYL